MLDLPGPDASAAIMEEVLREAAGIGDETVFFSRFASMLQREFNVDSVRLMSPSGSDMRSQLMGYVSNTRKRYVDSQLSEYSSFPELIEYRNEGFRSCAALPVLVNGKVAYVVSLLSRQEGRFTDAEMDGIERVSSVSGLVMAYKEEHGRSARLASYFDASFTAPYPQFIISASGEVAKANKAAQKQFSLPSPSGMSIFGIVSADKGSLSSSSDALQASVVQDRRNPFRAYVLSSVRISDSVLYASLVDCTDTASFKAVSAAMSATDGVCGLVAKPDLTIISSFGDTERLLGYQADALQGHSLLDFVPFSERRPLAEALPAMQKGPLSLKSPLPVASVSSPARRYVRVSSSPFLSGCVLLLSSADSEMAMESMKADLKELINSSSDPVLTVDGYGYVRECNIAAERVLGFTRSELPGREVRSLYREQDILDRDMNYVRNGGKVGDTFVNLVGRSGELIPATHTIRLLGHGPQSNGGATYLMVLHELATKRRLEDQESVLKNQETQIKKLKSEGDLKSQFIYNISHELKTPLTNIKGFSRLMYDGEFGQLNEDQKNYLKTTLDEADRLMLVIQQVLDAAKLEADKVKLDWKEVDMQNMANNPTIKSLEEAARGKGLEFKWVVAWDVPKITADPNRLIQVFVNLIGNAIKFTNSGSITVSIARKDKRNIVCSVIDTGIGIADDDKKKLFRRKFFEATKKGLVQQPGAGTGLGLSITRDIVRLHGGKISFESKQGEGSTFWFTVPMTRRPPRRQPEQPVAQQPKQ